jgi:hypothetical protein
MVGSPQGWGSTDVTRPQRGGISHVEQFDVVCMCLRRIGFIWSHMPAGDRSHGGVM